MHLAQDEAADALLSRDPFALLLGMLLDQQIPMEKAFTGPWVLATRLGTSRLDPAALAAIESGTFAAMMAGPPAVHRYHASMAARVQALAGCVSCEYGGDAAAIWTPVTEAEELFGRLRALPGFSDQKSKIFLALLGKQRGVRPRGWQRLAGVVDPDSLLKVREFKQAAKAAIRDGRAPRA